MNNELLYLTIFATLENEDKELTKLTGQGIFFAPELHVAFILGKEIKKNDTEIFGHNNVEWLRETTFGDTGPSDFAFKADDKIHVFELKLRDTDKAYFEDIEKLKKLDNSFEKYFLALVDSWEKDKDKDPRIISLEKKYPELTRVSKIKGFSTNQDRYKSKICCTVGLWTFRQ